MEEIIERLKKSFVKAFEATNRFIDIVPTWIWIALALTFLFLTSVPNGNEEQYLQLSKQYIDPQWIVNSQNLTETPGTRLMFQLVFGYLLKFFSFECVVFFGRLFLIGSFTIVLSKIYKKLRLDNFQVLLHLALFLCVFEQSFFAKPAMILSVEPKSFAWLLVLMAIYYIFKNKLWITLILLIVATYMHILVGGYSVLYLFATLVLFRKSHDIKLKTVFKLAIIYSMALLPFIIYLKSAISYTPQLNDISPDWIYTYFRSPHHTAIAKDVAYFYTSHFYGVLLATIGLFFSIYTYRQKKDRNLTFISQFVIISLAGTLLLVSVAFIDRTGAFLKFYLYRINTLSTFFLLILVIIQMRKMIKPKYIDIFKTMVLVYVFFIFAPPMVNHLIGLQKERTAKMTPMDKMCEYVKYHTEKDALIFSFYDTMTISRKSERSLFVMYKFIPAEINKINGWYQRIMERDKVMENTDYLDKLVDNYGIDYVICPKEIQLSKKYELIDHSSKVYLYKIRN